MRDEGGCEFIGEGLRIGECIEKSVIPITILELGLSPRAFEELPNRIWVSTFTGDHQDRLAFGLLVRRVVGVSPFPA